mmetsp:Transcript_8075/g.19531  ORF Transcript_8075/g.19531 Transcript_8075/m.19531 type:complete len:312 (+) Transcript_8075:2067-3002(+)
MTEKGSRRRWRSSWCRTWETMGRVSVGFQEATRRRQTSGRKAAPFRECLASEAEQGREEGLRGKETAKLGARQEVLHRSCSICSRSRATFTTIVSGAPLQLQLILWIQLHRPRPARTIRVTSMSFLTPTWLMATSSTRLRLPPTATANPRRRHPTLPPPATHLQQAVLPAGTSSSHPLLRVPLCFPSPALPPLPVESPPWRSSSRPSSCTTRPSSRRRRAGPEPTPQKATTCSQLCKEGKTTTCWLLQPPAVQRRTRLWLPLPRARLRSSSRDHHLRQQQEQSPRRGCSSPSAPPAALTSIDSPRSCRMPQ